MTLKPDCDVRRLGSSFFPLCPDAFQHVLWSPCQALLRPPSGSGMLESICLLDCRITSLLTDTAVSSQAESFELNAAWKSTEALTIESQGTCIEDSWAWTGGWGLAVGAGGGEAGWGRGEQWGNRATVIEQLKKKKT